MYCECGSNKIEGRTGKCASCNSIERKAARLKASDNHTPINRLSEKSGKVERRYFNRLKTWKRGKKCAATFPHECSETITVHHMHGRSNAPFDEWAQENEVPLTLDERFWMPLCINAHDYVTEHSKFAWENGYSFKRITDKIFLKP